MVDLRREPPDQLQKICAAVKIFVCRRKYQQLEKFIGCDKGGKIFRDGALETPRVRIDKQFVHKIIFQKRCVLRQKIFSGSGKAFVSCGNLID